MQIHEISGLHGAQPIQGPHHVAAAEAAAPADPWWGVDELEISPEADLVSRAAELPEIRADRIDEIRAQIADGVYETDQKLDIALGRLLDELSG